MCVSAMSILVSIMEFYCDVHIVEHRGMHYGVERYALWSMVMLIVEYCCV